MLLVFPVGHLILIINEIGVQVVTGISNKGEDFFRYKIGGLLNHYLTKLSGLIIFQREKGAFSYAKLKYYFY